MKTSFYRLEKRRVMGKKDRIRFYFLMSIGLAYTILFGRWWFQASHLPQNFTGLSHGFDIALFIILTYIVWYQIINELFLWAVAHFMKHPVFLPPQRNMKVAFLTAFVPGKEPYDVLENTLQAMTNVDYPHDTWLLDEGDDPEAKRLCRV